MSIAVDIAVIYFCCTDLPGVGDDARGAVAIRSLDHNHPGAARVDFDIVRLWRLADRAAASVS